MTTAFITIAEAVTMTEKSRRTIQRLVEALIKQQPDLAMKEKTDRGYIPLQQASALACWCPLDNPCHADVLISYLNHQ